MSTSLSIVELEGMHIGIRSNRAARGCLAIAALLLAAGAAAAGEFPEFNRDPAQARILTDDLDRFWAAWDMAERQPDARREIVQREYLDAGSPGLRAFLELRIGDVDQLLAAIDAHPDYYAALRAQDPGGAAEPVYAALHKLQALLPESVFPDIYLLVGRMNSGGTVHWEGLLIGVEMYGRTADTDMEQFGDWHRAVLTPVDELPAIIIHELIHFQQIHLARTTFDTLLGQSIHEGAADFVAERVIGRHINSRLREWALPREAALWAEFREVMHGQDLSAWLYNGATAGAGRPADLGYFMGYRIVQAYYEQAQDKRRALRDILGMTDPAAFLEASGYARRHEPVDAPGGRNEDEETGSGMTGLALAAGGVKVIAQRVADWARRLGI